MRVRLRVIGGVNVSVRIRVRVRVRGGKELFLTVAERLSKRSAAIQNVRDLLVSGESRRQRGHLDQIEVQHGEELEHGVLGRYPVEAGHQHGLDGRQRREIARSLWKRELAEQEPVAQTSVMVVSIAAFDGKVSTAWKV